jgi:hypothetical protein
VAGLGAPPPALGERGHIPLRPGHPLGGLQSLQAFSPNISKYRPVLSRISKESFGGFVRFQGLAIDQTSKNPFQYFGASVRRLTPATQEECVDCTEVWIAMTST